MTPAPQPEARWEELARDFYWHFQNFPEMEFKSRLAKQFAQVAAEARSAALEEAYRAVISEYSHEDEPREAMQIIHDTALDGALWAIRSLKSPSKEPK